MSTDPAPGTAIAVVEPANRPRELTKIDEWESSMRSIRHSFNTDTDAGRLDYLACLTGSDKQAQHAVGTDFVVVGWLLHAVERVNDDTGEVAEGLRLVFLTDKGERISTGSGPLIDNWAHVVRMFSTKDGWPRLAIKLKATKARTKGSYLQIDTITTTAKPAGKR